MRFELLGLQHTYYASQWTETKGHSNMFVSAEMRWFWNGKCPKPVHDWFFRTGSSPGGGHPRIDKYLLQPHEREIGLKERGGNPGLEIKGLVGTVKDPALAALTSDIEIWCK